MRRLDQTRQRRVCLASNAGGCVHSTRRLALAFALLATADRLFATLFQQTRSSQHLNAGSAARWFAGLPLSRHCDDYESYSFECALQVG